MNSIDSDDDETLTAYHEAGHAVVAYVLGGHIDSIQLGGEADERLPERFGDCRINWGPVSPDCDWQRQREVMAILAGPVAEMIYSGQPYHPAHFAPWQDDWQRAWAASESLAIDPPIRTRLLEEIIRALHQRMQAPPCWAAIAAVADELLAHEFLSEEMVGETITFWLNRP